MIAFISTPYSHWDSEIKKKRLEDTNRLVAQLAEKNPDMNFFSPIVYGMSLINSGAKLPDTYQYWENFCDDFVRISDKIYFVNMPGYQESNGMALELQTAKKFGKDELYLIDFEKALNGEISIIEKY